MSYKLEAKEVLKYLNDLGYYNISAIQLKEFMIDLKKLIKFDEKRLDELETYNQYFEKLQQCDFVDDDDDDDDDETCLDGLQYCQECSGTVNDLLFTCKCMQYEPQRNVFNDLYNTETIASKAKKNYPKESVIRVQIKKPLPPEIKAHDEVKKCPLKTDLDNIKINSKNHNKPTSSSTISNKTSCPSLPSTGRSYPTITIDSKEVPSAFRAKSSESKPPKSFIRTKPCAKLAKSDPVALYHKYCKEWKKIKLPGQNNHNDVRWAIRAKLAGRDC